MRQQILIKNSYSTVLALSMLLAIATPASADGFHQVNGSAVLGGAIGGGAGAAVGSAIGGRNGAIVGSAVGAAAGVAIATPQPRVVVHAWEHDHDAGWHRHSKHKHYQHHRHHYDD